MARDDPIDHRDDAAVDIAARRPDDDHRRAGAEDTRDFRHRIDADRAAFAALQGQLSQTDGSFNRRPAATGSDPKSGAQTDC